MKKLLSLFLALVATTALWASNTITYTATEKLQEVTYVWYPGLHTNAFNVEIELHKFSNGEGTITFAGDVSTIGKCAFYGCEHLTSITIPNSVTEIGVSAFESCTSLTSIEIPNSVKTIGESAFWGCSSLASINIPNTITSIGNSAFYNCRILTSITIGNSVTTIGKCAFNGCSGLTSITIPNSVTTIGESAFNGCSGLTSITIPNSVTTIGVNAFNGCTSLPIINNLRYADTYLVEAVNKNLLTYIIKDGTRWIGSSAFSDCTGLNSITIPNSVTTIGVSAFFRCSGLTSVTIPNSVTTIGESAFNGCSGLTSITIPNSVKTIGESAFFRCENIKVVTWNAKNCNSCYFGSQVESFSFGDEVEIIPDNLCKEMSKLTSVTIPNSVTTIGESAFNGCSGLTSITIPNSVTTIGNNAFYECSGLSGTLTIPNSVTTIGNNAFYNCRILTSITIGNSVKTIGGYAFAFCSNLKGTLTIPNSVTTIGDYAFDFCSGFTSLTVGNSVKTIGERGFTYCSGLRTITIPNSVTTIGKEAFYNCTRLKTVFNNSDLNIIKGSTENGYVAYYADKVYNGIPMGDFVIKNDTIMGGYIGNATDITIPVDITQIGNSAFSGCNSLVSITISNSVKTIGESAFENCIYLKSVTLGKTLTNIGCNAFKGDYRIEEITSYAEITPNICTSTFDGLSKSYIYLYVPENSIRGYQVDPNWNEFDIRTKSADVKPIDGDNPIVITSDQDVTITWPITNGSDTYTLTITKNGEVVCVLIFNAQGQLQNIALAAPGHDGASQSLAATVTAQGYQFIVTGLDRATKYGLGLAVKDKEGQVIKTYTGAFATTGYVPQNYTIAVNANDDVMGRVTGSGTFEELSSATITAIPNEHYHFVQWNDGNTNNPRQIIVEEDKTYTAIFSIDQHIISATAEHGIVSGAGIYDYGKEVTLTATPNEGYEFVNWSNGITANPYTFTVEQDIELTAKFKEIETGWQDIHSGINATKFFHNGNLIIERNGVKYTATGQKVR